mgnify:CR=1 FL=1
MDTSPSVYDHPVLRGSASSLLVVFSLWSLILIRGNDTAPFARVLQPVTLNDFLWLGGALTAAHLTGLVSGYLRTSWLWLALSIGLTPLYWLALAGGCAVAGASICGSPVTAVGFAVILIVAYLAPVLLMSGLISALRPRRRKPIRARSAWPPRSPGRR